MCLAPGNTVIHQPSPRIPLCWSEHPGLLPWPCCSLQSNQSLAFQNPVVSTDTSEPVSMTVSGPYQRQAPPNFSRTAVPPSPVGNPHCRGEGNISSALLRNIGCWQLLWSCTINLFAHSHRPKLSDLFIKTMLRQFQHFHLISRGHCLVQTSRSCSNNKLGSFLGLLSLIFKAGERPPDQ